MTTLEISGRLASCRQTIDNIDAALIYILAERFRCTDEVGLLKAVHGLPPIDNEREERQFARLRDLAEDAKIDQEIIINLTKAIIKEVVQRHHKIAAEHQAG